MMKENDALKDAMNTHNLSEAEFWLSEWFGAGFYYLINYGKISFNDLSKAKYRKRTVLTGWFVRMILVFGGLWLVWKLML